VLVADPFWANPVRSGHHHYEVSVDHVIRSIMLGILTYDANLLVIQPRPPGWPRRKASEPSQEVVGGDSDRR
jgi:hypothetical protein